MGVVLILRLPCSADDAAAVVVPEAAGTHSSPADPSSADHASAAAEAEVEGEAVTDSDSGTACTAAVAAEDDGPS